MDEAGFFLLKNYEENPTLVHTNCLSINALQCFLVKKRMFLEKFMKCSQCINIVFFFLQVTTTRSTASSAITGSSLLLAIAAPVVLIGRTRTAATCSDTASRPSRTNLSINFLADQCFNFLRLPYGIPAIQLAITFLIKPDDPNLTIL